jgi:dihydrodipicolinate synthase/N-acetylneuraminate lyase
MSNNNGIISALTPPFNDNGSVNEGEFFAPLRFLLKAGSAGMVVSGNAGEFYALCREETFLLIVRKTQGACCTIIGLLRTDGSTQFVRYK